MLRLAFAQEADVDLVSDTQQADCVAKLAVGFDGLSVYRRDDIARMDAGLLSG